MQWTKEHDAFCLENRLPPAAKLLWQWLSREAKLGDEIEPDLNDFNNWVAKHRDKPYCRPTLKAAMTKLIELRVVAPLRQFTWRIFRLVVRPLDWLKPTKKNCRTQQQTFVLQPSNPLPDEEEVLQQQQRLKGILDRFGQEGIAFGDSAHDELLSYTDEEIELAIAVFHQRGGHQVRRGQRRIPNPPGWVLECLRNAYWEDQTPYLAGGLFLHVKQKLGQAFPQRL